MAFGLAYVFLASRRSIWCWPVGIVSSVMGVALFISVKIYAEALLYTSYVIMGVYGWYKWKNSSHSSGEITVALAPLKMIVALAACGYAATWLVYLLLSTYTDAEMPLLDSYTTIFSIIATWLTAKRYLENWLYWICMNGITIYLYFQRGLPVFTTLSFIYALLSVYGYISWNRKYGTSGLKITNE